MNLPASTWSLGFAALTVAATTAGGALALKSRDRFHLVLGLAAGLLLGLVGFDLLPEVFSRSSSSFGGVRAVSIAIIAGFFLLHILEGIFGSHEPAESHYGHEHDHGHVAGTLGAIAMAGHVFLDGMALGISFRVSHSLGLAVFIAIVVHAFSDGLNTVSMMIKSGNWSKNGVWLLAVDGAARLGGATLGSYLVLNDSLLALYLAAFSGFLIYIATSHILPEAHSRHPSRWTFATTALGIAIMWVVVAVTS